MPVATSSRRKVNSRRQNSSDIEEDAPTQQTPNEGVDESDDDRPRRSSKKAKNGVVKKESKVESKRRADPEDSDDEMARAEDDEESDDETINVTTFHDQPLRKVDAAKLRGISEDWIKMEANIHQHWAAIGEVAVAMADTAEGENATQDLDDLDQIMKDFIDIGAEMKAHAKAIDDIQQQVARDEEIDDAGSRYSGGVASNMAEYNKKTSRQKYAKREEYVEFRTNIYEVLYPGKPMPPIMDFIPKEDGDVSDDDDDLEVGGVTQNYHCPLTLTYLINPVTSNVCGHSFSAEAIKGSFHRAGEAISCPAAGCNKTFKASDLKANKELAKKVKAHIRRTERAAENSDAEEIVE